MRGPIGAATTSADGFTVDLDTLGETVGRLARCGDALGQLVTDLDRRVAALQSGWEGEAAHAQAVAHGHWTRGYAEMQDALAQMRAAAETAHGNYTNAADACVSLWEQVR